MQSITETAEYKFQLHVAFTLSYMVSFLAILNCVNAVTGFIGVRTPVDTAACYLLLWGSIGYTLLEGILLRRCRVKDLGIFAFMAAAWLLTELIFPQNTAFMFTSLMDLEGNPFYLLFLYSMPAYLLMMFLRDFQLFFRILVRFSYIVILLSAFVYFFCSGSSASQYMTLSYNMLLQTVCLLYYKPKKKLFYYAVLTLGFVVIVIGGSRGALAGLLTGVILRCLFTDISLKKKMIRLMLLMAVGGMFLCFYTPALMALRAVLSRFKMESRNIDALLTGFLVSNERLTISEQLVEQLTVFGRGLYGDRVILYGQHDVYAHNLYLEWMVDFGLFGGVLISGIYTVLLIWAVLVSRGKLRELLLVLIPAGFIKLMLSGSYLEQEPAFYCLLGACLYVFTYRLSWSEMDCERNEF